MSGCIAEVFNGEYGKIADEYGIGNSGQNSCITCSNTYDTRDSRMSSDNSPSLSKVQSGDIFKVFRDQDESVLSTTEIAEQIEFAHRSTVRRQLIQMREDNELKSKKAGKKENAGVVWYPPNELPEIPQPTPKPLVLIYTYPWFSLMVGGLLSAGLGFLFFVPGILSGGDYLGLVNRYLVIEISLFFYAFGVAAAYLGAILIIGKFSYTVIQTWKQGSDP